MEEPIGKRIKFEPDQTLEVLMTDLDPAVMSIFTKKNSSSAAEATQVKIVIFYINLNLLVP